MKSVPVSVLLASLLMPVGAWAHHGGVSLAFGPGSPVETSSPLTLPEGGFVLGGRVEQVAWKKFSFADPNNKSDFTFLNANMSYGFTPALMGTIIVPYSIKREDNNGQTSAFGDPAIQFTYGFHYDPGKGFSRNTVADTAVTLEGSNRIHLAVSAMVTIPAGDSNLKLDDGTYDTGMQAGFGAPSYTLGVSAARAFGSFTLCVDTSYNFFTERRGFQYGPEWRFDIAGVQELYGKPDKFLSKLDGILELNYLQIGRDKSLSSSGDYLEGQQATGGKILYLSPGARFSLPSIQNANLGLLVKFPVWKRLNEQNEQQGSEGLEKYRAIVTLSFYF
jgi:hypothetical protein